MVMKILLNVDGSSIFYDHLCMISADRGHDFDEDVVGGSSIF